MILSRPTSKAGFLRLVSLHTSPDFPRTRTRFLRGRGGGAMVRFERRCTVSTNRVVKRYFLLKFSMVRTCYFISLLAAIRGCRRGSTSRVKITDINYLSKPQTADSGVENCRICHVQANYSVTQLILMLQMQTTW